MAAFGKNILPEMVIASFENGQWNEPVFAPSDRLELHPGAHVLHYSSTCFEGLKAFRHKDGSVFIFRPDANVKRMAQSSRLLRLPEVNEDQLFKMITDLVARFADDVPLPPGSMYIRPVHIGSEAAIGAAASPSASSLLYVLVSPVGDYFSGDSATLRILLKEDGMRSAPHMGMVKSGGNYASALGPILDAKAQYQADQILFCPDGHVQETGAANFIFIQGNELLTKSLDTSILHGVTRDSILTLAKDCGLQVVEKDLTVDELLERSARPDAEAALSGTAAVLAPVGTFIHNDKEYTIGSGQTGEKTRQLRQRLCAIQSGEVEDKHHWLKKVN
ncbi:branched-chain amino acid aminotransferase [Vibrio aerogenes]|uniref:branched-chain amino acid aminotransferase n=1 Tax=Vibrio aerogenes TaxID=92172 RepID=UPI0039EE1A18